MSFLGNKAVVPVVMFHSIGIKKTPWAYSHLSEPVEAFEEKVAALSRAGFNFIHWQELYDYMSGKKRLPLPAIMLTFDDGYLDNWVFAYPILKKYGAKGTIFVAPEFVDPREIVRPNLEHVWHGMVADQELDDVGYLSWAEMRVMEKEDLIDIQSHSLTHTSFFCGPKVIDFVGPGEKSYPWLQWNLCPAAKPYSMGKFAGKLGATVYEHKAALICRRFWPPPEIDQVLASFMRNETGEDFFRQREWKAKLQTRHETLWLKHQSGSRTETEEEYRRRIFHELTTSKRIIEQELQKEVRYISWPAGWYNETVASLAREAGYKSWPLSSRELAMRRNVPHLNPEQIRRMSSGVKRRICGRDLGYMSGAEFYCNVKKHQGSLFHTYKGKVGSALKLAAFLKKNGF